MLQTSEPTCMKTMYDDFRFVEDKIKESEFKSLVKAKIFRVLRFKNKFLLVLT